MRVTKLGRRMGRTFKLLAGVYLVRTTHTPYIGRARETRATLFQQVVASAVNWQVLFNDSLIGS